jgi:uncharacterized membrane protein/protein-disulfide isomerase
MIKLSRKNTHKTIIPLPYYCYYIPVTLAAFVGLCSSIYLAISHYRVHADLSYSSFCAISRALNCDTVSSSPYAVFLGVPLAVWGIIGYAAVLFILFLAGTKRAAKRRLWPLLFWASLLFSIYSFALAGISTFIINSYCIMCILTYLVNFTLLYYAWFINRRFGDTGLVDGFFTDLKFLWEAKKASVPVFAGCALIIGVLGFAMPEYWKTDPPALNASLARGETENGHPWIGAQNPELVIEEFTDYLCSQCRIKHFYLRRLVAQHPKKIRLVHRHFPMDHKFNPLVKEPFHMGAGTLALLSIYAQKQDKFWQANDMFFQLDKSVVAINTRTIAERLDLDPSSLAAARNDRTTLYHLQKDIEEGLKSGFTGTPGYVVNGETFQGRIPPRVLKEITE